MKPSKLSLILQVFLVSSLLIGVSKTLTGCAGKKIDENDPASLMTEAEDEIKSEHYLLAIEKLRLIKNKFPYSKHSALAQLRVADVYYLQESYGEAAASYETFRDLHPKHEKTAYAMFRVGKSYFNDIPSNVSRDLSSAQKALDSFQDFLRRFPTAPEAAESRNLVTSIRNSLAERELYIGNFYFRDNQWVSARGRFEKVLAFYSDTTSATDAKKNLELAKLNQAKEESQKEASGKDSKETKQ